MSALIVRRSGFSVVLAAACLSLAAPLAWAQAPAAPTIDAVAVGDGALTVAWTAPAGVAGITAYDLRHIPTAADETVEADWTVEGAVWSSGPLHHVLAGLINGAGYDVQVRAVTAIAGAWSATVAGTPTEAGGTRQTAAAVPLDVPLGGVINPGADVDFFALTLSQETDLIIRTGGTLDNTVGELLDANGTNLAGNDDGLLPTGSYRFLIRKTLGDGTYYIRVSALSPRQTGPCSLHVDTVTEPGGMLAGALPLDLGAVEGGRVDPATDIDYFRIDLAEATRVFVRAVSDSVDIDGAVIDATGEAVEVHVYETTFDCDGPRVSRCPKVWPRERTTSR